MNKSNDLKVATIIGLIILIGIILLAARKVDARSIEYRCLLTRTKQRVETTYFRVNPSTNKTTCYTYNPTTKKFKSVSYGQPEEWTGLYDPNGVKMYENDVVSTPGYPNATIQHGQVYSSFTGQPLWFGWYLLGVNGEVYSFNTLPESSKTEWSTVLSVK